VYRRVEDKCISRTAGIDRLEIDYNYIGLACIHRLNRLNGIERRGCILIFVEWIEL
jgi:hypothetical protein